MFQNDQKTSAGPESNPTTHLDRQGFAARFRTAYSRLWQIAAGMTGDADQADDIVQEATVVALRKLDTFDAGSNFAAWMSTIVRHCARNYIRKTRNRGTVSADPIMLDMSASPIKANTTAGDIFDATGKLNENQSEFDDNVLRGLLTLKEEARCCLLLRVVRQLSYAEISELMQISPGTAMSHVHRGKAVLRRYVQDTTTASRAKKSRQPRSC